MTKLIALGEWSECDPCPKCEAEFGEWGDEPIDSDGTYTQRHNYECLKCGAEWYLLVEYSAFMEAKNEH